MAPRWFGPKEIGWVWRPVTAAGWIVTAAVAMLAALLGAFLAGWGVAVALVAYFAVIALTSAKAGHSGF